MKVTPLKAGDKSGGTLTIEFFDSGDLQDLAAASPHPNRQEK